MKTKSYLVSGKAFSKKGNLYPFRKRFDDCKSKEDATNKALDWIYHEGCKPYNKGKDFRVKEANMKSQRKTPTSPEVKLCKVCGPDKGSKPLSAFGKDKNSPDGLMRICKECRATRDKENKQVKKIKKETDQKKVPAASFFLSLLTKEKMDEKDIVVNEVKRVKIDDVTYIRQDDVVRYLTEVLPLVGSKIASELKTTNYV